MVDKGGDLSMKRIKALFAIILVFLLVFNTFVQFAPLRASAESQTDDTVFFSALDLDYPGLESVKAAVENNDYETARAELANYYRNRTAPYVAAGFRLGDQPQFPIEGTGSGQYHATLTIDWTGWKLVSIPFEEFSINGTPIGWNKIDRITFDASGWGHTPTSNTTVIFDDIKIINESESRIIADFEESSQLAWLSLIDAETITGLFTEKQFVKAGANAAKWTRHDIMKKVECVSIPHNWMPYDALEFWAYSPEATNASVEIVLTSEYYNNPAADELLNHLFFSTWQQGEDIDWTALPPGIVDVEWTYQLNRHEFWLTLADAYWGTGDEAYAQEWVNQLTDWIEDRPVPSASTYNDVTWRTLEAGIRLPNHIKAFTKFLGSAAFTDDALIAFLKSILDHGRYLHRSPSTGNNWAIIESVGLIHAAVMFPEFAEADTWYADTFAKLENELSAQINPDGSHVEFSMLYDIGIPFNYLGSILIAEQNDREVPGQLLGKLENAYAYFAYMNKPTNTLPQTNDSDLILPYSETTSTISFLETTSSIHSSGSLAIKLIHSPLTDSYDICSPK
jgi:hypothetical protein